MPICRKCGVEIEEEQSFCPLCGSTVVVQEDAGGQTTAGDEFDNTESVIQRKIWFLGWLSFFAAGGIAIVLAVDLAYDTTISWSRYPLISIAYVWISIVTGMLLKKRIFSLLFCEAGLLGLFFWLFNIFTPIQSWFSSLAFPVFTLVCICTFLILITVRVFKLRIMGILSVCLVMTGIFLIFLEIVLNRYLSGRNFISWSLIACACILTLTAALLLIQKEFGIRGSNLKKRFHA